MSRTRLLGFAAGLTALWGCDPFDALPPEKHQDWSCGEICDYSPIAFGCLAEEGPVCATPASCDSYCSEHPDITQELLNCLAPTSLGLDMTAPNTGQFAAGIAARRQHCEFLLGLPNTSATSTTTETSATTTTEVDRVGVTVTLTGSASDAARPMLGVFTSAARLDGVELPALRLIQASPLALPQSVDIPAPEPAWMSDTGTGGPGLVVLLVAWDDLDESGVQEPGEPLLGVATPFPVWNNTPGQYDWPVGWAAATWPHGSPALTDPVFADLGVAPPVLAPPPSVATVSGGGISGSVEVATGADLIVAISAYESILMPGRPVELELPAAGQPFAFDVLEPANPARVQDAAPLGPSAVEFLLTFDDTDNDGTLTDGDLGTSAICATDAERAALIWLADPPITPEAWWAAWFFDLNHGWNLVGLDVDSEDPRPLDAAEWNGLFTASAAEAPCGALP